MQENSLWLYLKILGADVRGNLIEQVYIIQTYTDIPTSLKVQRTMSKSQKRQEHTNSNKTRKVATLPTEHEVLVFRDGEG